MSDHEELLLGKLDSQYRIGLTDQWRVRTLIREKDAAIRELTAQLNKLPESGGWVHAQDHMRLLDELATERKATDLIAQERDAFHAALRLERKAREDAEQRWNREFPYDTEPGVMLVAARQRSIATEAKCIRLESELRNALQQNAAQGHHCDPSIFACPICDAPGKATQEYLLKQNAAPELATRPADIIGYDQPATAQASRMVEPVAWIGTYKSSGVIHLAKKDGWDIQPVLTDNISDNDAAGKPRNSASVTDLPIIGPGLLADLHADYQQKIKAARIEALEWARKECHSFSLDPVPEKRIKAAIAWLRKEGAK